MVQRYLKGLMLTVFIIVLFILGLQGINGFTINISWKLLISISIFSLFFYYILRFYSKLVSSLKYPMVLFFTFTLYLILVCIFFGIGRNGATNENRQLAQFPSLPTNSIELTQYPKTFETAINDNFPLRSFITKIYSDTLYNFNVPINRSVITGKNNFLYLTLDRSLEDFMGIAILSASELNVIKNILIERNTFCKDNNSNFLYVICPDKQSMYPEFMPKTFMQGNRHRSDQLFDYMKSTDVPMLILIKDLIAKKSECSNLLYYYNDTHWNAYGAFYAFNLIQEQLGEKVYSLEQVRITQLGQRSSDISQNFLNMPLMKEDEYNYEYLIDGDIQLKPIVEYKEYNKKDKEYINPQGNGKSILMFHDSFMISMLPYFTSVYSKVRVVWSQDFNKKIVEEMKPDYVIQETVERYIMNIISN